MTTTKTGLDELTALRKLEKAVRACGLPAIMISGQPQLDSLAAALKDIDAAREAVAAQAQTAATRQQAKAAKEA